MSCSVKFLNSFIYQSRSLKNLKTYLSSPKKVIVKLKNMEQILCINQLTTKSRYSFLLLWAVPFLSSTAAVEESSEIKLFDHKKDIKNTVQEADELFESNKYQEAILTLLPLKDSGNLEVLWRISRAQYNLSKLSIISEPEKRRLICEAYATISEALTLDGAHWAVHKWMSVLLDAYSSLEGIKTRLSQLEHVKNHMLKAAELNPSDGTTLYMLGLWCYQIANMPWYQRKIAATIFAAPPTSSFEEALHYFSKAEEAQPRFYSSNLLMMGKTLLKLGRQVEAAHYMILARDYPSSTEEDNMVQKEAVELLKNMKLSDYERKAADLSS